MTIRRAIPNRNPEPPETPDRHFDDSDDHECDTSRIRQIVALDREVAELKRHQFEAWQHLRAALIVSLPTDEPIIMDHIRAAMKELDQGEL